MRDNRHAHLAHAQYRNLRETLGDSFLATIISVALSIVAMPLACSYLDLLHLMHKRTLKILL